MDRWEPEALYLSKRALFLKPLAIATAKTRSRDVFALAAVTGLNTRSHPKVHNDVFALAAVTGLNKRSKVSSAKVSTNKSIERLHG